MSINSKNKSGDYYDNVVNHKPKQVRSKFFKNVNNSNDHKNKSKESLTFNAITRVFMLALFTLIMVLGFTNGTLDFIQDHKEVYAVENYIESDFKTFDDINGKTIKFNNKINFDYTSADYIRLVLDVNKVPNYNYTLFTITNNDNFTIDYIINKDRFNYTGSAFIYFSELSFNYNGSFVIRYPYPNLLYLYSFVNDEWTYDNSNQKPLSITFSNDFTNYITNADIPYYSNLFIQFLNYNTTTLLSSYSDEYYYYDWRFKLKQLSNFRPLFYADDVLNNYDANRLYSPENYYSILKDYYEKGYVNYSSVPMPNGRNWYITLTGYVHLDDNSADDFINYLTGYRDALITDLYACDCFYIDNGIVVPIDASYEAWQSIYYGKYNSGFGFINGIIGFLNAPINFTYNVYVFFDFILRW